MKREEKTQVSVKEEIGAFEATVTARLQGENEVEKRARQLATLMKISAQMIRSRDLHERLRVIAEAIRLLGWRRVVISHRDRNLEIIDLVTAGLTPEEQKMLLERKAPGHVWKERFGPKFERYRIGEFYYLPWSDPWVREHVHHVPPGSPPDKVTTYAGVPSRIPQEEMVDWHPQDMLYAPLRTPDGRIVGILSMDDPTDGRKPTKESLTPLELFLYLAAVAIENAELIKELEEAREQIKLYAEKLESIIEKRTRALRESEERRVKAERLAAIGELAASVGHDLRNPLTAINGAVYCLRMKMRKYRPNEEVEEMFHVIEKASKYANKIVEDLLDFSREMRLTKSCVTVTALIEKALKEIEIPESVKVKVLTDETTIHVDPEQMGRVFTNIMKNAVEAMPRGGELKIRSNKKDGKIIIEFEDTGVGIPKKNLKRIFEPLFTTKARGVGLGLKICKRIVDAHGGKIEVESRKGKGTIFKVILPLEVKQNEKSGKEEK